MQDETTIVDKDGNNVDPTNVKVGSVVTEINSTSTSSLDSTLEKESKMFNTSMRGFICLILIATTCALAFIKEMKDNAPAIDPSFLNLVLFVSGIYFGQSPKKTTS